MATKGVEYPRDCRTTAARLLYCIANTQGEGILNIRDKAFSMLPQQTLLPSTSDSGAA